MVADKRKDIAVLRTLGARSDQIVKIFIIQGSAIGIIGVALGLLLGCIMALFIGDIVSFIERVSGSRIFDPAVYMINSLPSKLIFSDIMLVVVGASSCQYFVHYLSRLACRSSIASGGTAL